MGEARWELHDGEKQHGPFAEAEVLDAVAKGVKTTLRARYAGTEAWYPIAAHPAFARAMGAPLVAPPQPSVSLPLWAVLFLGMGVLFLFVSAFLLFQIHDRIPAAPERVGNDVVSNNCHANNGEITCTFSNLTNRAVSTCLRGRVTSKKAAGVSLMSVPLCSGPIASHESKTLTSLWVGGFARDVCNSTKIGAEALLDWDACEFTTEPVP